MWVIASSLEKQKLTERNSKDIIQRRVRDLYSLVDNFSEQEFTNNYKYTDATTALKRIETAIKTIRKLAAKTGLPFPESLFHDIIDYSTCIDSLLTNIPGRDQNDAINAELTVIGGICTFSGDRLAQIHESFDQFKDSLLELEIAINVDDVPVG